MYQHLEYPAYVKVDLPPTPAREALQRIALRIFKKKKKNEMNFLNLNKHVQYYG